MENGKISFASFQRAGNGCTFQARQNVIKVLKYDGKIASELIQFAFLDGKIIKFYLALFLRVPDY